MSPNNTGPTDHRHHRFSNGATILSAAWQIGYHFVGGATVIRPSGTVLGRFLTATGKSLDEVRERLLEQGRNAYKEP